MSTLVVWDDALLGYDLGDHPLDPVRVELTMALARALGVLDRPGVEVRKPEPADDETLLRVHRADYLDAVKAAGHDPFFRGGYGLATSDNPVFDSMHEASALVAGATLAAARSVWRGETTRAVNVAGGLHHAMPARASGFCVYNDPAIAIAKLLDEGAERIAYIDIDVHHGDGVQDIFYDDPRVLTVSLHESPLTLFPGTGFPGETGGEGAEGYAVNVALPPGTGDRGWLRAFHAVVPSVRARVPAAGDLQPVRRRLAPPGPARRPAADRRRAARRPAGDEGARGRALRRQVGRHRRRWLRARRGGPADLDPPARLRHRRPAGPADPDPTGVARAGAGPPPRP